PPVFGASVPVQPCVQQSNGCSSNCIPGPSDIAQVCCDGSSCESQRPRVSPGQLRVITDLALRGLCRQLRSLGVDAKSITDGEPRQKCVEYHRLEKRVILAKQGKSYRDLCGYVLPSVILCIKYNKVPEQVMQVVRAFNLKITKDQIFSRCASCNEERFLGIHGQVMSVMADKVVPLRPMDSDGNQFDDRLEDSCAQLLALGRAKRICGLTRKEIAEETEKHGVGNWRSVGQLGWTRVIGGFVNVKTGKLLNGRRLACGHGGALRVEHTSVETNMFFVCCRCGHVFWEGSHLRNFIRTYSETYGLCLSD
ncbi:unnamed protein product, partial [Notodromas monacha]